MSRSTSSYLSQQELYAPRSRLGLASNQQEIEVFQSQIEKSVLVYFSNFFGNNDTTVTLIHILMSQIKISIKICR